MKNDFLSDLEPSRCPNDAAGVLFVVKEVLWYTKTEVIPLPEICRFYGIVIKMFFKPKEHEPSHIHALYGEHIGIFDLKTMQMTEGDLPKKAQELVKEWMSANQKRTPQYVGFTKAGQAAAALRRDSYAAENTAGDSAAGLYPAGALR